MIKFFFSYLLFAPFLGAVLLLLKGSGLGPRGAATLTLLLGLGQMLCCAVLLPLPLQGSGVLRLDYGIWFEVGSLRASWAFLLDALSLPMASLVVVVSTVTQLYAYWYMATDPAVVRFQAYLQLFTFGMLLLVFGDNFGVFFLGWEGVGLCSFLLIGFWHHRPEARYAALKAVTVNRVGDVALLAAVGLLTSVSGSLEFGVNFAVLPLYADLTISLGGYPVKLLSLANGLLLVAVAAKSAQLGLHTWLADAMEGPTPVSALIHAATMVTAGIYLVLRCSSLFTLTPEVNTIMALLGAYTAFFGAVVACCQWDIKKVVAYSTCSQLGYMLCACGVGGYGPAFQHLLSHGFFKALLFLAAGVLIHQLGGEQDLRRMGALRAFLPLTVSYFGVGFAALLGLPGTSGYYSKERILDLLGTHSEGSNQLCYGLLWLALVGTAFYSAKVLYYAFGGFIFRGSRSAFKNLTEAHRSELPRWLLPVLGLLVLLSLTAEQLYYPYTVAIESAVLEEALGLFGDPRTALVEAGTRGNRWLPFGALILGVTLFGVIQLFASALLRKVFYGPNFMLETLRFGQQGWHFDTSLQTICFGTLRPLLDASFRLEKGLLEWLGPYGMGLLLAQAQRWLDVANLNRAIFGSLGLSALAYELLLLAVFGVDANFGYFGEFAIFPFLAHTCQKAKSSATEGNAYLARQKWLDFIKPKTHKDSTGIIEDARAKSIGIDSAHQVELSMAKQAFTQRCFDQANQIIEYKAQLVEQAKTARAALFQEAAAEGQRRLNVASQAKACKLEEACSLAQLVEQAKTARAALFQEAAAEGQRRLNVASQAKACKLEEACSLAQTPNKSLSFITDPVWAAEAKLFQEAPREEPPFCSATSQLPEPVETIVETIVEAQQQTVVSFLYHVLSNTELRNSLDFMGQENPPAYLMFSKVFSQLEVFGSDGLLLKFAAENPDFCGLAAVAAVSQGISYFCELYTVNSAVNGEQISLMQHMHSYETFLNSQPLEKHPQPAVSPYSLLSLSLESSWNARLSAQQLKLVINQVYADSAVFPFKFTNLLLQGFEETLLEDLKRVAEDPKAMLKHFSQVLLVRQPEDSSFCWGTAEFWHQRGLLPLKHVFNGLLNKLDCRPDFINRVPLKKMEFLARHLLENRAAQHQLPANILEFGTPWRRLVWASCLCQATTTLWLDQLAVLNPVIAGTYALPAELQQALTIAAETKTVAVSAVETKAFPSLAAVSNQKKQCRFQCF